MIGNLNFAGSLTRLTTPRFDQLQIGSRRQATRVPTPSQAPKAAALATPPAIAPLGPSTKPAAPTSPTPVKPAGDDSVTFTRGQPTTQIGYDATGRRVGTPSTEGVFEGLVHGDKAYFDGVTLDFNPNGDDTGAVGVEIAHPDGKITGTGRMQEDGSYLFELSNGQQYSARLDVYGSRATLSDVEFRQPKTSSEPNPPVGIEGSFKGLVHDGTVHFEGLRLRLDPDLPPGEQDRFEIEIDHPAGKIKGVGVRQDDGSFLVDLGNGQQYTARLDFEGNQATLSDVRLHAPKTDSTPTSGPGQSFDGVLRGDNAYFDGITLGFHANRGPGLPENFSVAIHGAGPEAGLATRQEDGSYIVELRNGQRYSLSLQLDEASGRATIAGLQQLA